MPKYFFHSVDGERILDQEGTELADKAAARLEAVRLAGEVLAGQPEELWETGHWRVEVTDINRRLLFTIITLGVNAPRLDDTQRNPPANDDPPDP